MDKLPGCSSRPIGDSDSDSTISGILGQSGIKNSECRHPGAAQGVIGFEILGTFSENDLPLAIRCFHREGVLYPTVIVCLEPIDIESDAVSIAEQRLVVRALGPKEAVGGPDIVNRKLIGLRGGGRNH